MLVIPFGGIFREKKMSGDNAINHALSHEEKAYMEGAMCDAFNSKYPELHKKIMKHQQFLDENPGIVDAINAYEEFIWTNGVSGFTEEQNKKTFEDLEFMFENPGTIEAIEVYREFIREYNEK